MFLATFWGIVTARILPTEGVFCPQVELSPSVAPGASILPGLISALLLLTQVGLNVLREVRTVDLHVPLLAAIEAGPQVSLVLEGETVAC